MKKETTVKQLRKIRRTKRIRRKILGGEHPRLTVFRSNRYIYAQIIDDASGKTLVSANEGDLKGENKNKIIRAQELGVIIAKKAVGKKIEKVVFDKGGYKYHGRVKALSEGAREGGLKF